MEGNPGPPSEDDSDQEAISQPPDGQQYCPFPTCAQSLGKGKGWKNKTSVLTHVSNYHVSAGSTPPKSWLRSYAHWVCCHCNTLHSSKRSRVPGDCFAVIAIPSHKSPVFILPHHSPLPHPKTHPADRGNSHDNIPRPGSPACPRDSTDGPLGPWASTQQHS